MCIAEEPCEAMSLKHGSERGGIREGSPLLSRTALIWSTPTASASRPSTGPRRVCGLRSRRIAGPGWWPWPTPSSAWRGGRSRMCTCRGSLPNAPIAVR